VRPKTYLETTIVSYLTSWPSREPLTNAHQELTREWWDEKRSRFDQFISEVVLDEAGRGDQVAAAARLGILESIPILRVNDDAKRLAAAILKSAALPPKAAADAMHIAVATVNSMDFLLTWNCTHIANAIIFRTVAKVCREMGFEPTTVCTPEELTEG
jgi:hypothetical protein